MAKGLTWPLVLVLWLILAGCSGGRSSDDDARGGFYGGVSGGLPGR